jgi:hypothetical protein
MRRLPATEALHVTERFSRSAIGRIDIDVTIDDPKAYTKPWTVQLRWSLLPDTEPVDVSAKTRGSERPWRSHGLHVYSYIFPL